MDGTNRVMGCLFVLVVFSSNTLLAADKKETEILVDQTTTIVEGFATDPHLDWFRNKVKEAKALLIIPQNLKGAFLVGGSGGSGVLLARDAKTGDWSYPGFYTLDAVSVGLQIGAEASEVILMVMTERGMEKMLTSNAKLGTDMTVEPGGAGPSKGLLSERSFTTGTVEGLTCTDPYHVRHFRGDSLIFLP